MADHKEVELSDGIGNKAGGLSERRAWLVAYERLKALDECWGDPQRRTRCIDEARRFLLAQHTRPRLYELANLLTDQMSHRALWSVLVPVERVAARNRISDAEILSNGLPVEDEPSPKMPATVVLDSLRSALNLGGILRCCECFGFERAVLCGYTADPEHPRVRRSAMGCEGLVATQREEDVCSAISRLKREGRRVVALETVESAEKISSYEFRFPCAVVLGNERFGMTASALECCDDVVRIPLYGIKNSLNVVSAFAIAAYSVRSCYDV